MAFSYITIHLSGQFFQPELGYFESLQYRQEVESVHRLYGHFEILSNLFLVSHGLSTSFTIRWPCSEHYLLVLHARNIIRFLEYIFFTSFVSNHGVPSWKN